MKIGIIGLGSIGQRHGRTLLRLGHEDIIALRSGKGSIRKLPAGLDSVEMYSDPGQFFGQAPDGIIISNPSSLHVKTLGPVLKHNIPVFVEKPLSVSLSELKSIRNYDHSRVMVGFCLRHHIVTGALKRLLISKKVGKVIKATLYCGNYLPLWHPYTDYRNEYFSRRDLGGGVLRTLSHEIDLMHFLFGPVSELAAFSGRLSALEIDVDDTAVLICRMAGGSLTTIELDYLNASFSRHGTIFCSNGTVKYSFRPLRVVFTDYKGEVMNLLGKKAASQEKADETMYMDQMKNFLGFVSGQEEALCTYPDGVEVMRVIDAAEQASERKRWQKIKR